MLSNKDRVISMIADNGLTSFHVSHAMQGPCDPSTRGVYGIVDIQANVTRDLPWSGGEGHGMLSNKDGVINMIPDNGLTSLTERSKGL